MQIDNSETQNWTLAKKVLFRFFFCFFIFDFFLNFPLYSEFDWSEHNTNVRAWFNNLYNPLYKYINSFLHLKQATTHVTVNQFIYHVTIITMAVVVSILWSYADKKRKSYNQADYWLRHILKYVLAIFMFFFGMFKLIPLQMPMPNIYSLAQPFGNYEPRMLLGYTMGASTLYQCFTGLLEVTVTLLLIFPKTFIIGLITLFGALVNILMLNIGFDFGATYMVMVFLASCIYLLFPYLKSIILFFFYKQSELYQQPKPQKSKLSNAILISSAILFIISAVISIRYCIKGYSEYVKLSESTRTFDVVEQTHNSDTLKMVLGDEARWKYWIEYKSGGKNYLSVVTMNDSISYELLFQNDTVHKIIYLKPEAGSIDTTRYTFSYSTGDKKEEEKLIDSLHKTKLVIKQFGTERWELLKNRNKLLPFDF